MSDTAKTVWKFSAMDSLFFRDGSPMNMGESAWVDSIFPPTGQTLQGAIRAAILDYLNANIRDFQKGKDCLPNNGGSLKDEIGDACSLGALRLTGPFLEMSDEVFFPAPLDLVKNQDNAYSLLCPSEKPVQCDMDDTGGIRLPAAAGPGWKPLTGKYISAAGMQEVLRGDVSELQDESHGPKLLSLIAASCDEPALADREPKIGLARNNAKRTNIEGMLFAVAPVRPREDVALLVQINGVRKERCPSSVFLQKLGGKGRLAAVTTGGNLSIPPIADIPEQAGRIRFKMVFITPALFADGQWLPQHFIKQERATETGRMTVRHGVINGCEVDVISACIGKPHKTGGWNLAQWHPKALRSFVPAGSVFFCEADADRQQAVQALHNSKTGDETEYGFGHILIGKW